jgi:hypothetical protein
VNKKKSPTKTFRAVILYGNNAIMEKTMRQNTPKMAESTVRKTFKKYCVGYLKCIIYKDNDVGREFII